MFTILVRISNYPPLSRRYNTLRIDPTTRTNIVPKGDADKIKPFQTELKIDLHIIGS